QGHPVNSVQLSLHADRVRDRLEDDRQETLFAGYCMHRESRGGKHGLAGAVRLGGLRHAVKMPRGRGKAGAAAAMVHDLGKGMLPPELWRATTLSMDLYKEMQSHVGLLLDKMDDVKWLSDVVKSNLIEPINERLNGSG